MRKFIIATIMSLTIAAMLAFTGNAAFHETDVGDANSDGTVNAADVLVARKFAVSILEENKYIDIDAADIDADGSVNLKDVIRLRRHCVGTADIFDEFGHVNSGYPVSRLTLCGYGIEQYEILIPDNTNDNLNVFSAKLSQYIKNATGTALSVVTPETATAEHFIEIRPDTDDLYGLGKEGYIIETNENGVIIHGGVPRGCMYGMLDFLSVYVDISFKEDKTVSNKWTRVAVETGIWDRWEPLFEYRCVRVSGYGGLEHFMIPDKINALESSSTLQSSRYGNALGRTFANAHSFASLIESADEYTQPCLSDSAILAEATVSVLALIEQREAFGYVIGEEMNQISCSLEDNPDYCVCSVCKAAYAKEGTLAGTLLPFVNAVATTVGTVYPDIDIFTIAYYDYRIPPKTVYPVDNVIICYCWNGCNNHMFGSGECAEYPMHAIGYNSLIEESYYLGWADKTDNLYVWYYSTSFVYALGASPNIYNLHNDIRWLYDHGCKGVFVEGSGSNAFEGLKGYLAAIMEENPLLTYEEYLESMYAWLENHYGAGWESILKYIDMTTEAGDMMSCFVNNYEMPFDMYNREYMAEHYKEMEALFEDAYSKAKTQTQKNNIRKTSVHMYFLCLSATYEDMYLNGDEAQKAEWEADYSTKLYAYAKNYGVSLGGGGKGLPSGSGVHGSPMEMWYGLDMSGSRR